MTFVSHTKMNESSVVATRPVQEMVTPEEWETRVNLAAFYRAMAHYGLTDLIYNHISARVPGEEEHFLINAFGYDYTEITASNLYKIDLDGNIILRPDTPYDVNQAGFVIHSAIHQARKDLKCIAHTHTPEGMAVSAMDCGILPLTQTCMRFYGCTSFHDYEEPAVNISERERIARDLGENDYLILRNHGLLAAGPSIPETFNRIYWMELACKIQIAALTAPDRMRLVDHSFATHMAAHYKKHPERVMGMLEWESMLRLLDRKDPSFRT